MFNQYASNEENVTVNFDGDKQGEDGVKKLNCVYCGWPYVRTSSPFTDIINGVVVEMLGIERDECAVCHEFFPTLEGQRVYEKQIEVAFRKTGEK